MKRFQLTTIDYREQITLPLNPPTFDATLPMKNKVISLVNAGEVNLAGRRGIISFSPITSFFPSAASPFFRYAHMEPEQYVATLLRWETAGEVLRLIVTETSLNSPVLIESFKFGAKEGDKDIPYTLQLKEYRFLNITPEQMGGAAVFGLGYRPDTFVRPKEYYVKSRQDTFFNIAVRFYGDGNQWGQIAAANPGVDPNRPPTGTRLVIP